MPLLSLIHEAPGSHLWQVSPLYPVRSQMHMKSSQDWIQRLSCSHRLGVHLGAQRAPVPAPAQPPNAPHSCPGQYLSVIPQTLKNTFWYCASRICACISTSTGCMSTFSICRQPWKAVWFDRQPVTEAGLGQPARQIEVSSPQVPIALDPALPPTSKEVLAASA